MGQRIMIEGRNLGDLLKLSCVRGIYKKEDGSMLFFVQKSGSTYANQFARVGDILVEDDNGTWSVEKRRREEEAV